LQISHSSKAEFHMLRTYAIRSNPNPNPYSYRDLRSWQQNPPKKITKFIMHTMCVFVWPKTKKRIGQFHGRSGNILGIHKSTDDDSALPKLAMTCLQSRREK
jgi:hypothetical protein